MRVFDRYLARVVDLPNDVEPGRYRLLENSVLNGDVEVGRNELLLSDGRERCVIGENICTFLSKGFSAQDVTDTDSQEALRSIVRQSVAIIAAQIKSNAGELPSPLLPQQMADDIELNDLDEALNEVIDRGHLDEIVRKPRFSMKYEPELVDVSRVRRCAPGALNRLSARSEDWHRRTLSGVLPKRLLAMISDDDWNIYENKVFARLMDRLEEYLRHRLAETEELQRVFIKALELNEAEDLDYRLRTKLCRLWGEATVSSVRSTESAIDESKDVIARLQVAKRKIGLLRHSELYSRVPRAERVPAELRHTNILNHDQHYRHLKTLWHLHQKRNAVENQSPGEVYRANRRELQNFSLYIQMMVRRVLRSIQHVALASGSETTDFEFAGMQGSVIGEIGEISVRLDARELVVVPVVGTVPQQTELNTDGSGRLIVSSLPSNLADSFSGSNNVAKGNVLSINPLDFYGEEKLRAVIERFLWLPVFQSYGKPVNRLPASTLTWLQNHRIGSVQIMSWYLFAPLDDAILSQLRQWLPESGLNPATQDDILVRAQRIAALGICRHCGGEARFIVRNQGFKAECPSCNTEWGIYPTLSGRVGQFKTNDAASNDFRRLGSWFIEFVF